MSAQIIRLHTGVAKQQLGLVGKLRELALQLPNRRDMLLDAASALCIAHELFWQKPQCINTAEFVQVWTDARLLYRDCTGEMV